MVKVIKFGVHYARFYAGERRATLSMTEMSLSTKLADVINETSGVSVNAVLRNTTLAAIINMTFNIPAGELLYVICEAINRVYNVDTSVSNA